MTEEIKARIEQIKAGRVLEGYTKQYKYVFPVSWKLYHLGELTQNNSRRNMTADELPTYSINNQVGFIPQNEQFDEGSYSDLDKTCYKIVKRGEFAYNPARINVGSLGLLKDKDAVIVSSLYVCFSLKKEFSNLYFENWFTTASFHKEILRNLEGSVREYLFYENFSNIRLPVPPLPEQKKIAEILMQCDKVIELKQSKIEELQELKRACLSKMFPKEGHNVPELRLPGFTDAWKQRKLSELADFSKGQGYTKSDLKENGTPIILYGRLYTKYQTVIREVDTFANVIAGAVFSKGGEVILPSSGETAEDIAIASNVDKSGILLGGGLNIVLPHKELLPTFLAIELSFGEPHSSLAKLAQGKSVVHLYNEDLKEVLISFPTTDEQAKISSYIDSLDNLITLHQRELEETRKYKKALMQLLLTGIVRVK